MGLFVVAQAGFAQEAAPTRPAPGPLELRCYSLGAAGLLAQFGSYGTFGAVQNRIGQSRAAIEASRSPGAPLTGYTDDVDQIILPIDLLAPLFGSETSFVKVAGSANLGRSQKTLTQLDVDTYRTEAEYLWSPTPAGLIGIGGFVENTQVDMRHNGVGLSDRGRGLRADLLQRFGQHWGLATRLEHTWTDREMLRPLGGGRAVSYDQNVGRLYSQLDLVGTYSQESLSWVPGGWALHPILGAMYQQTRFEDTKTNMGGPVSGSVGADDEYLALSGSLKLERMAFRPWFPAPYAVLGLEQELRNDLKLTVDDPSIAHTAVGLSVNLGGRGRLDLEYGRYDGLKGKRRAQSLTLHIGMLF